MFHVEHPWLELGRIRIDLKKKARLQSKMLPHSLEAGHRARLLGSGLVLLKAKGITSGLQGEEVTSATRCTSSLCGDSREFSRPDKDIPSEGFWDGDWFAPVPFRGRPSFLQIAATNPQNNLFSCNTVRSSPRFKKSKFADRSRAHIVQRSYLFAEFLVPANKDTSVRKFNISKDFRQKCGLFHIGLDQEGLESWPIDFQRNPGKTRSRTYVGEPTVFQRNSGSGVHTF